MPCGPCESPSDLYIDAALFYRLRFRNVIRNIIGTPGKKIQQSFPCISSDKPVMMLGSLDYRIRMSGWVAEVTRTMS